MSAQHLHPQLLQLEKTFSNSTVQFIEKPKPSTISLYIKRDDLLHPIISGNKWRKLKYILNHALTLGCTHLVSMGGPWSNHLHALAFLGQELGIRTTGLIRGEPSPTPSPSLRDMAHWGMRLEFVNRNEFRNLRQYHHWDDPPGRQRQAYWIGEGGHSKYALQGLAEILTEVESNFNYLAVPCGTGTTLAGLLPHLPQKCHVLGFAALKNASFLADDISSLLRKSGYNEEELMGRCNLQLDFHFGGFARIRPELLSFMDGFEADTGIRLDPVYTGKMMAGIYALAANQKFTPGTSILALHSGGLQGCRLF